MDSHTTTDTVLLLDGDFAGRWRWLEFRRPRAVLIAHSPAEVLTCLQQASRAADDGLWAAGWITYEAAPAFDAALVTRPAGPVPLLWMGLYNAPREYPCAASSSARPAWHRASEALPAWVRSQERLAPLGWIASVSDDAYRQAIARIKDLIAAGDTYQVNYTLRLDAPFTGSPEALFAELLAAQPVPYAALACGAGWAMASASPELFFRLQGRRILSRPMKGTAPRGLTLAADADQARRLARCEKNRAENLMILDMVRNDLGRIAQPGSVRVPGLFDLERYRTLWQMTSTVDARTDAPLPDILAGLFPCASITGAPKVRTMQIIAELEDRPRGLYTGCVGYIGPGRRAQFNVAIRTVQIDLRAGRAEYGVGGGIVWDSIDSNERQECLTKAAVLMHRRPSFRLLETLLWRGLGSGYFLLRRHLARLAGSAEYFGMDCDTEAIARQLAEAATAFPPGRQRVRLLVSHDGQAEIQHSPLPSASHPRRAWRVAITSQPIDSQEVLLYHKTTHRGAYDAARAAGPADCDDVILVNERGQITESTFANVVIQRAGQLLTPPVDSGLLAGTFRGALLQAGRIGEAVITIDDFRTADRVWLINSVRGFIRVQRSSPRA